MRPSLPPAFALLRTPRHSVIIASPTLGGLAMQRIRGTQTAASDGDLKAGESGSHK